MRKRMSEAACQNMAELFASRAYGRTSATLPCGSSRTLPPVKKVGTSTGAEGNGRRGVRGTSAAPIRRALNNPPLKGEGRALNSPPLKGEGRALNSPPLKGEGRALSNPPPRGEGRVGLTSSTASAKTASSSPAKRKT